MTPELEAALAQKAIIENNIAAMLAKPQPLSPTDSAMLKAYKRQLMAINAQIIILETPPLPPVEIPF